MSATEPDGRPAAYWFWSKLPDEPEIRRQLADFHAAGFSRIYIQARPSMPRQLYLSGDFLSRYRLAAGVMGEIGLKAGLYDDYAWTSGQAGGRVVAGAEHLRERHIFWAESAGPEAQISGIGATLGASLGPAVRDWLHEGGLVRCDGWALVAAVIVHGDGRVSDVTPHARLTRTGETGTRARLDCDLPEGARWTFFATARIASSRVINYLLPEAGQRFVDVGLEPYAKALGPLMPGVVDQLFFDQPAPVLYRWNEISGKVLNSFLWSDALDAAIRARGAAGPQLAALLEGSGGEVAETRSFVWRLYARMIGEAFFAPVRAFCDRNGLRLTGHEILPHIASFALNGGFSAIDPRVALAADFFGTDLWRDETAVDVNNLAPQLAPMLGAAIARASGRKGCLTELYLTANRTEIRAAGQWEITPAALRAQMIRLHLLGTSQVILHALYADAGDATPEPLANIRFDFSPGYNLQPWWGVMRALNDEITALAGFVSGAHPERQIAVLYPYETALTEGPRHAHAALFGAWCEALWHLGHAPLILDEAGLARISNSGEGAALYGSRLVALVLPAVTRLRDRAGIAVDGLPVWQGAPDLAALRGVFAFAPQVTPLAGLCTQIPGRDSDGWWRLVLFNESDAPLSPSITLGDAFRCESEEGVLSSLTLPIGPHGLLCLRLREAPDLPGTPRCIAALEFVTKPLGEGWTLTTDGAPRPASVSTGWQAQGDADFSGIGVYETQFTLAHPAAPLLALPGLACAARVLLDGRDMGQVWHPPFRLALGPLAAGRHQLRLEIANTAANSFYAGTPWQGSLWPDPSGLTAPPVLLFPWP